MTSSISKAAIVAAHARSPADTGSSEIAIALISARLDHLSAHLLRHPKDFGVARRARELSGQRKRQLARLRAIDPARRQAIASMLGLR